jgi:hypothetical protein
MPPKASQADYEDSGHLNHKDSSKNGDLIADAGKVHIDEAQMWGRGIVNDVKRTLGTHWVKEMINFNQKTVAVTLLLFITVIAPTLTFGAVYGKVTKNSIGAIETILATAWVGITYALIGGMPTVSQLLLACFVLDTTGSITFSLVLILFCKCTVHHGIHWTSAGLFYCNLQHVQDH